MYQGNILGKWMRAIGKNIIGERVENEKKGTILTVDDEKLSGWFKALSVGEHVGLRIEDRIVYVHPFAVQKVETEGKVYYLFTSDQVLMVK